LARQSGLEQVRGLAARLSAIAIRLRAVGCPPLANAAGVLLTHSAKLDALNPLAVLARGFAVVRSESGLRLVRSAEGTSRGDDLRITFALGADLKVSVSGTTPRTLSEADLSDHPPLPS
jgi:exonuclease VII large subunit